MQMRPLPPGCYRNKSGSCTPPARLRGVGSSPVRRPGSARGSGRASPSQTPHPDGTCGERATLRPTLHFINRPQHVTQTAPTNRAVCLTVTVISQYPSPLPPASGFCAVPRGRLSYRRGLAEHLDGVVRGCGTHLAVSLIPCHQRAGRAGPGRGAENTALPSGIQPRRHRRRRQRYL